MKRLCGILMMVSMIAIFAMGKAPTAHATLILTLWTINTTVIVSDGGAWDQDPNAGAIFFSSTAGSAPYGSIDNFDINNVTGLSFSSPVGMHFESVDVSSNDGGTLNLSLTDTFSLPTNVPAYQVISGISVTTDGTFSYLKKFNDIVVHNYGPVGPGSFGETAYYTISPPVSPFTLFDRSIITHGAGDGLRTSFDADNKVAPIPEPGTLLLLGSGLVGLAGYAKMRLKRRKS